MSETPRTDEAELTLLDIQNGHGTSPYVSAEICRQLERELADARNSSSATNAHELLLAAREYVALTHEHRMLIVEGHLQWEPCNLCDLRKRIDDELKNAAPQGQVVEGAASPAQPAVAAPLAEGETSRTDALAFYAVQGCEGGARSVEVVPAKFARQLERELETEQHKYRIPD